jgi:hypothetical protein
MRKSILAIVAAPLILGVPGCAPTPQPGAASRAASATPSSKTLRPFKSERELVDFVQRNTVIPPPVVEVAAPPPPSQSQEAPPPVTLAPSEQALYLENVVVTGAGAESVTNVQHAGVDEGGIVKTFGDFLVILRRGRLFTVRIGDGGLTPVSSIDAYGPGLDPGGAWYDEMLISGDVIAVIGYSYHRSGTEVGLFQISRDGQLAYRSTWHLRSDDYYSSRNYASRLVGGKLVFYSPLWLDPVEPAATFPAVRRWRPNARDDDFRPVMPATRVYRADAPLAAGDELVLHSVTVCDLSGGELACQGTAVLGNGGRVFYVSPGSVYVWVTGRDLHAGDREPPPSVLYRMPLDGSAPSALRVEGSPVDQFSFLESGDGHLNVLVASEGAGDGMWSSRMADGDLALMRVPLRRFGTGREAAAASAYRDLPDAGEGGEIQNRFVGDYLLYGTGGGWGRAPSTPSASLFAVPYKRRGPVTTLAFPHGVDRIEAMGSGAVIVGTDGRDLHFSGVRLGGVPEFAHRYTRPNASQGELRSHGFFYKPEAQDVGMLGLPIRGPGRPGYEHLFPESASILYLRNQSFRLNELGTLAANDSLAVDDACRASCVDWYGNSRPLFLRGRVFALLGYELVEGRVDDGRIREARRVTYFRPPSSTVTVAK